jgi:2-dehydro-3-deoxyphosphogluconate aldolase/(4S)-4-hydroxy-2-oxoglutarate aldolase
MDAPLGSTGLAAALRRAGFVPVVTIERAEHGPKLARALIAGGLKLIEVTLRTPAALDALKAIIREVPEAEAGAGTVLSADDYRRAVDAGARFAVSPGFTPALLAAARGGAAPLLPGVTSPTEAMQAREAGYRVLKFFPAEQCGGVAALKAFHGPLPDLLFCPTGGITEANLRDYLALPNVAAAGAGFVTPPADMAAGRWDSITERAKKVKALLGG